MAFKRIGGAMVCARCSVCGASVLLWWWLPAWCASWRYACPCGACMLLWLWLWWCICEGALE